MRKFTVLGALALAVTLCLVMSARADVIENLDFTGTATCELPATYPGYSALCGGTGNGPIKGMFSFDVTTQTLVGPWKFSTPFGVFSSTDTGAIDIVVGDLGDVVDGFDVQTPSALNGVSLYFLSTDTQEIGPLANNLAADFGFAAGGIGCQNDAEAGAGACILDYGINGSTSLATATPEPRWASILVGSLFLVGLYRRKNTLS